jgi:hypothetical protein
MSTKLYLVRRWGPNPAGTTVTVDDDEQARWLLGHNFAQRSKDDVTVTAGAAAPGEQGPDPRAGGDATRRRPIATPSSDERGNRAVPVAGSPVQYNAGVAPTRQGGGDESSKSDESEGSGEGKLGPSSKVSSTGRRRSKD